MSTDEVEIPSLRSLIGANRSDKFKKFNRCES